MIGCLGSASDGFLCTWQLSVSYEAADAAGCFPSENFALVPFKNNRPGNRQMHFNLGINLSRVFHCFPTDLLVGDIMMPAGVAGAAIYPCSVFGLFPFWQNIIMVHAF